MTQENSHPPTEPFSPDPTRKNIHGDRDPAGDLPTDPVRHNKSNDSVNTESSKQKAKNSKSGSRSHSTRGSTSQQYAEADSQSHKNK
jgi:hypothetical protein